MDTLLQGYEHLLAMAVLLGLSGMFSGSETALFSLKPADLNQIRRTGGSVSHAILTLHGDLKGFLMTVLFCNLVVNILFFATSTTVATRLAAAHGPSASVLFGIASLLLVITFGEVTPKSVATLAPPVFCRLTALQMLALHRLLWTVRMALDRFVVMVERMANIVPATPEVKAEELRLLVELSRADGIISSSEHELMDRILELPEVRMSEIMTPRPDMITIAADATVDVALSLARAHGHSKIPVRDVETDEVSGWVDARALFVAGASGPIAAHVQPAPFVSELDRADQVLVRLRQEKTRIALVVDERGSTAGLVTLWDVLAEIFGEIGDEDEQPVEPIREAGENAFLLTGSLSVREWRHLFGVGIPLPNTATLGGLITALLGRTARAGDVVHLGNLRLEVLKVQRRRVAEIHLQLLPAAGREETP